MGANSKAQACIMRSSFNCCRASLYKDDDDVFVTFRFLLCVFPDIATTAADDDEVVCVGIPLYLIPTAAADDEFVGGLIVIILCLPNDVDPVAVSTVDRLV
jgi:hypothetical protein